MLQDEFHFTYSRNLYNDLRHTLYTNFINAYL